MNLEEVRSALASIIQDGNRACKVIGCMRAFIKKRPLHGDHLESSEAIPEAIEFTRGEAVPRMQQHQDVGRALLKGAPLFWRREKAASLLPQSEEPPLAVHALAAPK